MNDPSSGVEALSYTQTELGQVIVGKDACPEAIAVADLDGDGWADLIALESPGYNYESQELVALHGPSKRIVWRALKGQLGKRLALSNGVVVVEGADARSLHGVESKTGQPLWAIRLPGELCDDPYGQHGMTWNAPSLTDHGAHVSFGCEDGSVHVIDSRTGQFVLSRQGRLLEPGHGVRGVVALLDGDMSDHHLELFDIEKNRSLHRGHMQTCAPMAVSAEGVLHVFHADNLPNGVPGTRAVSIDLTTGQPRRSVWVTPGKGNIVPHNGLANDAHRMAALGGDRLLLGSNDEERGGGIVIDLNARPSAGQVPSVHPISRMPPPQAGYVIRAIERFSRSVVTIWEHAKSRRLMALGYDLVSLEPRWFVGDAGGTDVKNHLLRTDAALLLPCAPAGKPEFRPGAPVYWAHIDPTTGARLAQYSVSELDCVRMFGKYLLGHSSSFPGAPPIVWDTERRERLL